MTEPAHLTPEDRVLLQVGGGFTPDTLGPSAYDAINRAVLADPDSHLDAFERLFLKPRPSRQSITELFLPDFLMSLRQLRPKRVERLARRLGKLMASLARKQAGEAENFGEGADATIDEIARQRRQLARRREGIAALLGAV